MLHPPHFVHAFSHKVPAILVLSLVRNITPVLSHLCRACLLLNKVPRSKRYRCNRCCWTPHGNTSVAMFAIASFQSAVIRPMCRLSQVKRLQNYTSHSIALQMGIYTQSSNPNTRSRNTCKLANMSLMNRFLGTLVVHAKSGPPESSNALLYF